MHYAHSTASGDKRDWHTLKDHLVGTSEIAARFGEAASIADAARQAGLLHDLGKYSAAFQRRLEGASEAVEHSSAGAWLALQSGSTMAELIAYAIAGHHAGLPDRRGERGSGASLEDRVAAFEESSLDPAWREEIRPDISTMRPPSLKPLAKAKVGFQVSFLGRMLFSCLVDADFKDTEAFFAGVNGTPVDRNWPALQDALSAMLTKFDLNLASLSPDGHLNALRREILQFARARAGEAQGLFTFTVPTGGGKTLASLAFALDHARAHGHRRIIYAAPFTAIIDQTAEIYRDILGEEYVLEHHSAIEEDRSYPRDENVNLTRLRHAMQDWAAPVIVTTNVQLFESLFAARPSRCRKLHNIAGSIIILDEAQTLPRPLLAPCMLAMEELAWNYGCSIVLCTATQPALDARRFQAAKNSGIQLGLELKDRELAPDPERLAKELRRVTLRFVGSRTDEDLVGELEPNAQALVVVNSRRHALALYRAVTSAGLDGTVHLSTRQCATDRKAILEGVKAKLKQGEACRVIATSLVEAGVDLDFPRVWRAEAGLDQIAQAAGRCNREGRRDREASVVSVFQSPDHPPPPEVRELAGDFLRMAHRHEDLLSPTAIEEFFGEVYWRVGADGLDKWKILDLLKMDRLGTAFSYRTAAEKFRIIVSGMAPVIVPRGGSAEPIIAAIGVEQRSSGALAREFQTSLVQVPPRARARLVANGRAAFAHPELRGDQFCVLTDLSLYTAELGLLWEDADFLAVESLVWA